MVRLMKRCEAVRSSIYVKWSLAAAKSHAIPLQFFALYIHSFAAYIIVYFYIHALVCYIAEQGWYA